MDFTLIKNCQILGNVLFVKTGTSGLILLKIPLVIVLLVMLLMNIVQSVLLIMLSVQSANILISQHLMEKDAKLDLKTVLKIEESMPMMGMNTSVHSVIKASTLLMELVIAARKIKNLMNMFYQEMLMQKIALNVLTVKNNCLLRLKTGVLKRLKIRQNSECQSQLFVKLIQSSVLITQHV